MNNIQVNSRYRIRYSYSSHILCKHDIRDAKDTVTKVPLMLRINDLSYSGIGFSCTKSLESNMKLLFNIKYKDYIREFKVIVKWCKICLDGINQYHYRCGAEFIDLSKDDIILLHNIISSL